MKIAILVYKHRYDNPVLSLLARVPDDVEYSDLPEPTNQILKEFGISNPELERDDEWAKWTGIVDVNDLPSLVMIKDGNICELDD